MFELSRFSSGFEVSSLATSFKVEAWFLHARCIRFALVQYEWADEDKTSLLGESNRVIHSTTVLVSENTKGSYAYKM